MKNNPLPKIDASVGVDFASVKVMRSYDYCHFEVTLGYSLDPEHNTHPVNLDRVDELRKHAMRLVDKAVEQYKIAKRQAESNDNTYSLDQMERKVTIIKENFPQSEWTPEQKATVKAYEDALHRSSSRYDYEDDYYSEERY